MRSRSVCCAAAAVSMLLLGVTSGAPAYAQPAAAKPPATTPSAKTASEYYDEGVKASEQNLWEKARGAFQEAWKLKQHWQIAANLGRAEFNVGKLRDAAEHLAYFLREGSEVQGAERQKLQDMFDKARAKVGALRISVSAAGAEVLVDGVSVGKAPLVDPVFVEPGARVVEARLEGVGAAKETTTAAAAVEGKVSLQLGKGSAEVKGGAGAGAPGGAAGTGAASGAAKPGGSGGATGAGGPSGAVPPGLRTGIIIGGSAGAGVALIAGIVFTAVANGKASTAREEAKQVNGTCPLPPPTMGQCGELATLFRARANFSSAAIWSFIGAGALGATTLIYAFATKSAPKDGVRAAPVVTTNGGGFVVAGAW